MANQGGYVKEGDVIGPAAQAAGDPGMGAVGYPVYRSFLQQALERMSFEVPWDKRAITAPVPDDRIIQLPPKFVGIENIYLYRGELCDVSRTTNVVLKDGYHHTGGTGAFQRNNWNNMDDATIRSNGWVEPWNLHYAGVRNSKLYLSPQCQGWENVLVEYLGIGIDAFCPEAEMMCPLFARKGIEDAVAVMALEHRIYTEGKEQLFTMRHKDKKADCYGRGGSWENAKINWGQMDLKDKADLALITGSINRL